MAATANVSTYTCNLFYGNDYISVTSQKTGKTLRLPYGPGNWSYLPGAVRQFLADLIALPGTDGDESEVSLSHNVMVRFKDIYDRFGGNSAEAKATVAVASLPPVKTPVAPAVVQYDEPTQTAAKPVIRQMPIPQQEQPRPSVWIAPTSKAVASAPIKQPCPAELARRDLQADIRQRSYGTGIDEAERKITRLQDVVRRADQQYYQIEYDIQDTIIGIAPNPSGRCWITDQDTGEEWIFPGMWHFAFRMSKSCWTISEEMLNHPLVQRLLSHYRRCKIRKLRVIRWHPEDSGLIRKVAEEELTEEIRRQHTSLIQGIDNANTALAEAQRQLEERLAEGQEVTEKDRARAQSKRDSAIRAKLKEAIYDLESAIRSAELYDETENVRDLLAGLRATIRSQASSFNVEMQARGGRLAPLPE